MERIEKIKKRLEKNKKWKTKTDEGYVPSIVGEYEHADVEWLIEQAEKLEEIRQGFKAHKERWVIHCTWCDKTIVRSEERIIKEYGNFCSSDCLLNFNDTDCY